MSLSIFSFYFFAFALLFSALMVVLARNPVRSVLFLIASFIAAACLFILMGAEYLAMMLLVVYVGAVAVLFLFVVMMLDIDIAQLRRAQLRSAPAGIALCALIIAQFVVVFLLWRSSDAAPGLRSAPLEPLRERGMTNIVQIGSALYTEYFLIFQIAGLILLVAMIGAILLTHEARKNVKKQSSTDQIARPARVFLEDIPPGRGATKL